MDPPPEDQLDWDTDDFEIIDKNEASGRPVSAAGESEDGFVHVKNPVEALEQPQIDPKGGNDATKARAKMNRRTVALLFFGLGCVFTGSIMIIASATGGELVSESILPPPDAVDEPYSDAIEPSFDGVQGRDVISPHDSDPYLDGIETPSGGELVYSSIPPPSLDEIVAMMEAEYNEKTILMNALQDVMAKDLSDEQWNEHKKDIDRIFNEIMVANETLHQAQQLRDRLYVDAKKQNRIDVKDEAPDESEDDVWNKFVWEPSHDWGYYNACGTCGPDGWMNIEYPEYMVVEWRRSEREKQRFRNFNNRKRVHVISIKNTLMNVLRDVMAKDLTDEDEDPSEQQKKGHEKEIVRVFNEIMAANETLHRVHQLRARFERNVNAKKTSACRDVVDSCESILDKQHFSEVLYRYERSGHLKKLMRVAISRGEIGLLRDSPPYLYGEVATKKMLRLHADDDEETLKMVREWSAERDARFREQAMAEMEIEPSNRLNHTSDEARNACDLCPGGWKVEYPEDWQRKNEREKAEEDEAKRISEKSAVKFGQNEQERDEEEHIVQKTESLKTFLLIAAVVFCSFIAHLTVEMQRKCRCEAEQQLGREKRRREMFERLRSIKEQLEEIKRAIASGAVASEVEAMKKKHDDKEQARMMASELLRSTPIDFE